MPPSQAGVLTWPELDSIHEGYERSQQRALVGPRLLAWQTYNVNVEQKHQKKSPLDYLYLDLIDEAPAQAPREDAFKSFLERRRQRGLSVDFEPEHAS